MLIFKHLDDIPKARLPTHLAQYIEKILTGIMTSLKRYDPENDGYIVLVTSRDTDENLCKKLGSRWSDNMFEGVSLNPEFRCYHAVIMANNQFTTSIVVPCEAWLDAAIQARMIRELA